MMEKIFTIVLSLNNSYNKWPKIEINLSLKYYEYYNKLSNF